ncbi:hypothetical protein ES707_08085 [subsurface metagenome]
MRYSTIFFKKDSGEIILVRRNTYIRSARQIKRLTELEDVSNISLLYFPHDIEIDPAHYRIKLPNHRAAAQLIANGDINVSLQLIADEARKTIEKSKDVTLYFEGGAGDYIMQSDVVAVLCEKYPDKTFTLLTDPSRHCLISLILPPGHITLKPNSRPSKKQKSFIDFSKIVGLDYYLPPNGKTAAYAFLAGLDPKISRVKIKVPAAQSKDGLKKVLPDPDDRKKRIIGLHLTSGNNNAKSWPIGNAQEMINQLLTIDNNLLFLQFGGYGEEKINHEALRECIGKPWDTVAALVKTCKMIICIDSAIMHIATHLNIPAVTLWGPLRPQHILPVPLPVSVVHGTCDKLFCGRYECNQKTCMKTISPDMIVKEVKKIWSEVK